MLKTISRKQRTVTLLSDSWDNRFIHLKKTKDFWRNQLNNRQKKNCFLAVEGQMWRNGKQAACVQITSINPQYLSKQSQLHHFPKSFRDQVKTPTRQRIPQWHGDESEPTLLQNKSQHANETQRLTPVKTRANSEREQPQDWGKTERKHCQGRQIQVKTPRTHPGDMSVVTEGRSTWSLVCKVTPDRQSRRMLAGLQHTHQTLSFVCQLTCWTVDLLQEELC